MTFGETSITSLEKFAGSSVVVWTFPLVIVFGTMIFMFFFASMAGTSPEGSAFSSSLLLVNGSVLPENR